MSSDRLKNCEWVRERIDPWIDGDLADADAAVIGRHVVSCGSCAAEAELARSVVSQLRAMPLYQAPANITARADAGARARAAASSPTLRERIAAWFGPRFDALTRPAMAAMILVVVAVGVFVVTQHDRLPTPENGYTQAEVEAAAAQARLAFAYVGMASRRAGLIIRDDVIAERIVPQVARALNESGNEVLVQQLVPTIQRAVLEAIFVETTPRLFPSKPDEGRPK